MSVPDDWSSSCSSAMLMTNKRLIPASCLSCPVPGLRSAQYAVCCAMLKTLVALVGVGALSLSHVANRQPPDLATAEKWSSAGRRGNLGVGKFGHLTALGSDVAAFQVCN